METVFVIYRSGGKDFRFDHDSYVFQHLVAVAVNEFRDEQAATAASLSPTEQ
ncbi:hypothetical protein [Actinoallomurus iriomotensis]|uniref:Uncharacterized protein n=1 Tax=Actinoallomurus iriomotensis TaxID=478107 RepID=A0A9W6VTN0_9ACTN|nr:hypothetical protein [Actinoallomurus iriomotensis]GLY79299.1 hypothetical protein Airi01_075660 [Actinoallomurus iriomotensis]